MTAVLFLVAEGNILENVQKEISEKVNRALEETHGTLLGPINLIARPSVSFAKLHTILYAAHATVEYSTL